MNARLIRMPSHARAPLSSALAAVFVALASAPAVAADFGHARVLSAAGAPLLVSVPVTNLTEQEVDTLRVGLADVASWQAAGLTPPAPLSTFRVALEPGVSPSSRVLRISSTQAPTGSAIDILLISASPSGRRQVQFTVLAQPDAQGWHTPDLPLAAPDASVDGTAVRARVPVAQRTPGESTGPRVPRRVGTVAVRSGDTLSEIAMARRVSGASYYQMIVAMWRANPDAFIQGNMNLVKTGARLTVPDAATIRAENAEDAKRLYLQQLADFDVYRGRAARGAALAAAVGGATASGRVESSDGNGAVGTDRAQDRLRLSAGDESVSTTGPAGQGVPGAGAATGGSAGAAAGGAASGATASGAGGAVSGTGAAGSGTAATGSSGAERAGAVAGASGSTAAGAPTTVAPGNASPEDARAANARALAEQGGRVDALRRDVDALNRNAAGAGGTPGTGGSSSDGGTTGVTGAGAGAAAAGGAAATGSGAASAPDAAGPGGVGASQGASGQSGTSAQPGSIQSGLPIQSGTSAGTSGQPNTSGQSGTSGQSNTSGQSGTSGQSTTLGQSGTSGQSGSSVQPDTSSQSGGPTQSGTGQGALSQGANVPNGTAPAAAAPGAPAAGSPGSTNTPAAASTASGAATGGAAGAAVGAPGAVAPDAFGGKSNATAPNDGDSASSLPAWLSDNLLVVITALLAIVAFIVAWVFRRAAARREDDDDGDNDGDDSDARRVAPSVAPVEIDPRLRKINLDLDEPPTDEPAPPRHRG